jgi:hypothetical protein
VDRHAANTNTASEEHDGRRHDQMPRNGARYPDRHNDGSGKVSMQSGIFRTHLLFDLQSQSRMVCQGCLGSRARREAAEADDLTCAAIRMTSLREIGPLRRGDSVSGSLAG